MFSVRSCRLSRYRVTLLLSPGFRCTFSNPASSLSGFTEEAHRSRTYSWATSAPAAFPVFFTLKETATFAPFSTSCAEIPSPSISRSE